MEINFAPLKQSPIFTSYQGHLLAWPVLSALTGALLTFLVQSGSSAIGMVIALSTAGVVPVSSAVAIILGEPVGTSCLAALGAINGTIAARRAALINILISVASVTLVLLLFPVFLKQVLLLDFARIFPFTKFFPVGSPYSGAHAIANAHAVLSILMLLLFLPMVGFFTRWGGKILPARKTGLADIEPRLNFIDFRVLNTPSLALQQARTELHRMAEIARTMFSEVVLLFEGFNAKKATLVKIEENVLDALQKDIAHFLVILARQPLPYEVSVAIPPLLRMANELESIGDNAEAVFDCLRRKKEENVYFSHAAMGEIREMAAEVNFLVGSAVDALSHDRPVYVDSEVSIRKVSGMKDTLKNNHLCRLSSGNCTVIAGLLYIDIISAFAAIGQSAIAVIEAEKELG
jgi:phosphate:Na+ symporter